MHNIEKDIWLMTEKIKGTFSTCQNQIEPFPNCERGELQVDFTGDRRYKVIILRLFHSLNFHFI